HSAPAARVERPRRRADPQERDVADGRADTKKTRVPCPGTLSTSSSAPIAFTSLRQIARPRPALEKWWRRSVGLLRNGWYRVWRALVSYPLPVSHTENSSRFRSRGRAAISTEPASVNLTALGVSHRAALAALQRLRQEQDRRQRGAQVVRHLDHQLEAPGTAQARGEVVGLRLRLPGRPNGHPLEASGRGRAHLRPPWRRPRRSALVRRLPPRAASRRRARPPSRPWGSAATHGAPSCGTAWCGPRRPPGRPSTYCRLPDSPAM